MGELDWNFMRVEGSWKKSLLWGRYDCFLKLKIAKLKINADFIVSFSIFFNTLTLTDNYFFLDFREQHKLVSMVKLRRDKYWSDESLD